MKKVVNNIGIKVSLFTICINFILFLYKLIVGIYAHSHAMVSDAIHSLSDILTTILVVIGLVMSLKGKDKQHPYGHERIECVFAILLSFILFLTGISIGISGIKVILTKNNSIPIPKISALFAAVISIIVKMIMYIYTMKIAKRINSVSMIADANHHKMDSLSSIGSFLGVLFARMGFPIFDPLFSVIICLIIIKGSIFIFIEAISQMIDKSCDIQFEKELIDYVKKKKKINDVKELKTRIFGSKVYVDITILLDGNKSLKEVNKIVVKLHDDIEKKFSTIKHCNIVVIPNN